MALSSWKTFNFFDVTELKLPSEGDGGAVLENNDFACVCSGSENLFFGSSDGIVRILSQSLKVIRSFKAHDVGAITHMRQLPGTALLLTVAEDLSNDPALKVWALDVTDKKTGIPRCQSSLAIHNGRKQFPISAFAALDDLSQIAVGFANGSITVIRGDLIHDRGTKQRTVFESEEPITGVDFRIGTKLTTLYIATTSRILTLSLNSKGQGLPARGLEDTGCAVGCMTVDLKTGNLIVARDDAVFCYGASGRGPYYAFDGPKKLVSVYKEYIALVSPPQPEKQSRGGFFRGLGSSHVDEILNASTFTLLDTDLKLVAHTQSIPADIKKMFTEWGDLFVLGENGKLFRYREKTLSQKLEILYQRDLYVLAINLAQKARLSPKSLNVINRKYGDYLYSKADFDGAMQQYLKSIDSTETSQIIRKFLDSQRVHNLIEYLEELHERHRATADHTTLLLNCYAKLKDIDKLEAFIKSPGDLKFDLDTAIAMCRQGGYFTQAAYLATKHGEHDLVVDILIEDSKAYPEALTYMCRLEADATYRNLMKYAHILLDHCSTDTTDLFIDYYSGLYKPKTEVVIPSSGDSSQGPLSAMQSLASLIPLPYISASRNQSTTNSNATEQANTASQTQTSDAVSEKAGPDYSVPKPRSAFSSFIDHPDEFIRFLEALVKGTSSSDDDRQDIYTTLFEMYLVKAKSDKSSEKQTWETKAKELIENPNIPVDSSNILLLSTLSSFRSGTVLVREKQGLYFDIFRSHTDVRDTPGALACLAKYGTLEPQLYPAALAYLTSDPRVLEAAGPDALAEVLERIDRDALLAPLQVVQTLSKNSVATMGLVKGYLAATIEKERKEIAYNRRLISSYRSETAQKKSELRTLGTTPLVFSATRCVSCAAPLDLPAVHFLCKHSFHQRCLKLASGDTLNGSSGGGRTTGQRGADIENGEGECPTCAPQNATIRAIRRAQRDGAERQDLFVEEMKRANGAAANGGGGGGGGGLAVVSEFFGRGVMGSGSAVEGGD